MTNYPENAPRVTLRAMRERLGYTLTTLADELGVSRGTLSAIETGRRGISRHMLDRLEETLELPAGSIRVPYTPVSGQPQQSKGHRVARSEDTKGLHQ
ncbi:helix-turn-helix domain-containing protein [Actinobaculum massiliense]|uniref:helix-turn-helix domain-containing protein n=1 Tax=Actinobaculum massiliense TaxID=202789 RepID=UPI0009E95C5D|nr:helix-turn-helix transcriptional regulator [Actinobaculum massiliense]